ncbi:hypothetical protein L6261_01375 [Candidatus Parcubacteria bacterium]|nr:hypothetical protein [Candidatus Parcubacteria bacterium]
MILSLFKKQSIPNEIPMELMDKIIEFSVCGNKDEFLRKSFFYIVKKWGGSRIGFFTRFFDVFNNNFNKIFKKTGYLHCTTMNYILRVMAVKSGLFRDTDIELKLTNTWFVIPHQYLKVKLNENSFVCLDPWNYQFGIDYGDYGSGFDSLKIKPVR